MRLWQRYAMRNALWWLEIENRTTGLQATRRWTHSYRSILNALMIMTHWLHWGQLATKIFINHWASPLYVHVSALKKYVKEIPEDLRAHHKDIVSKGRGFSGKVKMIGDTTYALSGWLWETHLQKSIKESKEVCDVQIMHRDGLFMGGSGALEKPPLWVVDC